MIIFPLKRLLNLIGNVFGFFTSCLPLILKKHGERKSDFYKLFRIRLELMGPTFIKLGQIMSVRKDLLPTSLTKELKLLLNSLPKVPFIEMAPIIKIEQFKKVYPNPLGTASICQAHLAETVNGDLVVIKAIKPKVRKCVLSDAALLRFFGKFLQLIVPRLSPKIFFDEFCTTIEREVDLRCEAEHIKQFHQNFINFPYVKFPKIYQKYCSKDMLCMEFFSGITPNNKHELKQLSEQSRNKIVETGTAALIKMIFEDGFFHADLHPGNIFILKNNTLGFIDLGMVGYINKKERKNLLNIFWAFSHGNVDISVQQLIKISQISKNSNLNGYKRRISQLFNHWEIRGLAKPSISSQLMQLIKEAYSYHIFFPTEISLIIKAMMTFEAIGREIAPNIDIKLLAKKYVTRSYTKQFHPQEVIDTITEKIPLLINLCENLMNKQKEQIINNKPSPSLGICLKRAICFSSSIFASIYLYQINANPITWIVLILISFIQLMLF